jgi:hypothetical protein
MAHLLDKKRDEYKLEKQRELLSCQQLTAKMKDFVSKEENIKYRLIGGGRDSIRATEYDTRCVEFQNYVAAVNAKSKQTKIAIDVKSREVNSISTSININKDLVTYHLFNS